jgi:hypothetical protein
MRAHTAEQLIVEPISQSACFWGVLAQRPYKNAYTLGQGCSRRQSTKFEPLARHDPHAGNRISQVKAQENLGWPQGSPGTLQKPAAKL